MPAEEEYQIPSQNCTRKHFLRESSREEICFANICQTVSNLFKELRSFPICWAKKGCISKDMLLSISISCLRNEFVNFVFGWWKRAFFCAHSVVQDCDAQPPYPQLLTPRHFLVWSHEQTHFRRECWHNELAILPFLGQTFMFSPKFVAKQNNFNQSRWFRHRIPGGNFTCWDGPAAHSEMHHG